MWPIARPEKSSLHRVGDVDDDLAAQQQLAGEFQRRAIRRSQDDDVGGESTSRSCSQLPRRRPEGSELGGSGDRLEELSTSCVLPGETLGETLAHVAEAKNCGGGHFESSITMRLR